MISIPKGICTKCRFECCGWALQNPHNQTCPKCGEALIITDSEGMIFKGYSHFNSEEYPLTPPDKLDHTEESSQSRPENGKDSAVRDE